MKRGQVNQKTGRGKKGRSKKAKHHNSRDNITPLEMIMVAKVKKEFTFISDRGKNFYIPPVERHIY